MPTQILSSTTKRSEASDHSANVLDLRAISVDKEAWQPIPTEGRNLCQISRCHQPHRIREILRDCCAFASIADDATHESESYLDVRLTFSLNGKICNAHLMAIPMNNLSHSGANYADLVVDVPRGVGSDNILFKLIGISSDGAANTLCRRQRFASPIRAWCGEDGSGPVYSSATMLQQYELHAALGRHLQLKYEDEVEGESPSVSDSNIYEHVTNGSVYSADILATVDSQAQHRLVFRIADRIDRFSRAVRSIKIEVAYDPDLTILELPRDVVNCADSSFRASRKTYLKQLKIQLSETALAEIWEKRKQLIKKAETTNSFLLSINRSTCLGTANG
ncbi:hypothetical protein PybrP1_001627, partial [[Pythium] brassicae (nom. inval.)]